MWPEDVQSPPCSSAKRACHLHFDDRVEHLEKRLITKKGRYIILDQVRGGFFEAIITKTKFKITKFAQIKNPTLRVQDDDDARRDEEERTYQLVANSWCSQCNERRHNFDRLAMAQENFSASSDWDVQPPYFRDWYCQFSCDKWSRDVNPCTNASTIGGPPFSRFPFWGPKFGQYFVALVLRAAREPSQYPRDERAQRAKIHTSRFETDLRLERLNRRRK